MATCLTCTPQKTPTTLAGLIQIQSPTHRAWTLRWSLGTAPPIQELRSLHRTRKTGGVARVRMLLRSLWRPLPTLVEAARAPAWCEGGGGLPQCHGGLKHETLLQRVEVKEGTSRGTTHGKFGYRRAFFPLLTVLMFVSAPAADDVCRVYWQRSFQ